MQKRTLIPAFMFIAACFALAVASEARAENMALGEWEISINTYAPGMAPMRSTSRHCFSADNIDEKTQEFNEFQGQPDGPFEKELEKCKMRGEKKGKRVNAESTCNGKKVQSEMVFDQKYFSVKSSTTTDKGVKVEGRVVGKWIGGC